MLAKVSMPVQTATATSVTPESSRLGGFMAGLCVFSCKSTWSSDYLTARSSVFSHCGPHPKKSQHARNK